MNKLLNKIFLSLLFVGLSVTMWSCDQDEPDNSPFVGEDSTVLIYAVATNSLAYNLKEDKEEILLAAPDINLSKNNVLICQTVYEYDSEGNMTGEGVTSLIQLVKKEGKYSWREIKKYSNETGALNPRRISDVIDFVVNTYRTDKYGLIFWSHSTASQPYEYTKSGAVSNTPMLYSFGEDKTTKEEEYKLLNVEDLASAIPDHVFDFIWFDSCYMSNIETIYQFRGKCNTFVGYPTEVLEYGLPYDLVMPHLVGKHPDLITGADKFFKFYSENPFISLRTATIAVTDMSALEQLADFCRNIYNGKNTLTSVSGLHRYSRGIDAFYDLGDYTKAMARLNGIDLTDGEWDEILSNCVLYKGATPTDFVSTIDQEKYSGISTHLYNFNNLTSKELYYQSLDWFKSVFN